MSMPNARPKPLGMLLRSSIRALASVLAAVRVPGWHRRIAIAATASCMASVAALLAIGHHGSDLTVALGILALSLLGFSFIAFLSFDCALGWRVVDFPWVLASFAAIVVALINISEAGRRERVSQAKAQFTRAFSDMIYATQTVVTNEFQDLPSRARMWARSPEPYEGGCDRMKHFLPQMQYEYGAISATPGLSQFNEWGMDLRVPDVSPQGSWAGLYGTADQFTKAAAAYRSTFESDQPVGGWLRSILLGAQLKYWYFIMAFFVGLRVSKTTAEILQARAAKRKAPGPT